MAKRYELDFREEIENFQPVSRTPLFQQRLPFQHSSGIRSNYDYGRGFGGYQNPFMNFMSGSNVQISYRDENGEEIPADPEYVPDNADTRRFSFRQNFIQPVQVYQGSQLGVNSMPSQSRQFQTNNFRLLNNEIQLVNPKNFASVPLTPLEYDNRPENVLRNVQQQPNSGISQRADYDSEKPGEDLEMYGVKPSVGGEDVPDDKTPLTKVDPTLPVTDTDVSVNEIVDIPTQDVGEAEDEAAQSRDRFIINEGGVEEKSDDETLDTASTNNFAYSYSTFVPHQQPEPVHYRQPHGNFQQQNEHFQQQSENYHRPANYYQQVIHYQPDPSANYIGKPSLHSFSDNH